MTKLKLEKPKINTERQMTTIVEEIEEPVGTLVEVVGYILKLQEKYQQYRNVTLNYVPITYEDYQYEVRYDRLETDDELAQRIQDEQDALDEWLKSQQKEQYKEQLIEQKQQLQQQLTQLEQELKKLK
ncbi:hypothetical protein [Laspinema olomoucense]|uniref:hypothetical protein n=1 Tax=Laspinema olomoucense TaxID=3231600 RepID=UPI0021BB253A|nr:hypothetical protein [Laspinema sp. D3d]MCT7971271.1 hypothetical protein [Laspinema sp. D3d]